MSHIFGKIALFAYLVSFASCVACTRKKGETFSTVYRSSCEKKSDGIYTIASHSFETNQKYTFETQYYSDENCQTLRRAQKGEGQYVFSGASAVQFLDLSFEKIVNSAYSEEEARKFKEYGWNCGAEESSVGSDIECKVGIMVYSLFQVSGTKAYFGALSGQYDGSSPERRPTELQTIGLERVSESH